MISESTGLQSDTFTTKNCPPSGVPKGNPGQYLCDPIDELFELHERTSASRIRSTPRPTIQQIEIARGQNKTVVTLSVPCLDGGVASGGFGASKLD